MTDVRMNHGATGKSPYFNCVADPWNAAPAQLPDSYSGHSIPLKIRQTFQLTAATTGTVGSAGFYFYPKLSAPLTAHSSFAASNVITWSSPVAMDDYTALSAAFSAYRFISVGVCVAYVGAESAAAGQAWIVPLQGATQNDCSATITDWKDYQGAIFTPIAGMQKPLCMALSCFDRPPFSALTVSQQNYFPGFLVGVSGAASAAPFEVQIVINAEFIGIPASPMHHMARPSPVSPADLNNVSRRLTSIRSSATGGMEAVTSALNYAPAPKRRRTSAYTSRYQYLTRSRARVKKPTRYNRAGGVPVTAFVRRRYK